MNINSYIEKSSPIHYWDARWKSISLFILIFTASFVKTFIGLSAVFFITIILIFFSKISLKNIFKFIKYPLITTAVLTPILIFTSGGNTLTTSWYLPIYKNGVNLSLIILLRSITIVSIFSTLLITTRHTTLFKSFEYLLIPKNLICIILSTYRFIFLFFENLENSLKAATLRGYKLKNILFHFKTSLNILISLLIRGFEQNEKTTQAMCLRGHHDKMYLLSDFKTNYKDILKFLTIIIFSAIILIIDVK